MLINTHTLGVRDNNMSRIICLQVCLLLHSGKNEDVFESGYDYKDMIRLL
jgi:hypothetical protein